MTKVLNENGLGTLKAWIKNNFVPNVFEDTLADGSPVNSEAYNSTSGNNLFNFVDVSYSEGKYIFSGVTTYLNLGFNPESIDKWDLSEYPIHSKITYLDKALQQVRVHFYSYAPTNPTAVLLVNDIDNGKQAFTNIGQGSSFSNTGISEVSGTYWYFDLSFSYNKEESILMDCQDNLKIMLVV